MGQTDKKRNFIIQFVYLAIWVALIYVLLKYALPAVMPFVIAYIIAFILKPLINGIARKTPLGRKPVSVLVLTLVYLVLGAVLVVLGARVVVYIGRLFANLPAYYASTIEPAFASVGTWFENFTATLDPSLQNFFSTATDSLSSAVSGAVGSISQWAVNIVGGIASSVPWFVVSFVLAIIASYFFVVDYYKITTFITNQLTQRTRRLLFIIKDFVVNVLFKFARAYLILMTLTFVEVTIGLLLMRVPGAIPIALLTAAVDILPIFGTGTVILPWAAYSLFSGNVGLGIGLIIMYALITFIRQVLEPRVVGRQIGLYPLLTLLCMFLGARFFGFWGMFGFPVTLTVLVHLNRTGEISLFKE